MTDSTHGNEMTPTDLTPVRDQLRSRSAYAKTRRFMLLISIALAIGGIFWTFMLTFDGRASEDHSVGGILGFLWIGIPLIIIASRHLNQIFQLGFDLADAALSREARSVSKPD